MVFGVATTTIAANDPNADPFRVTVHAISGSLYLVSGMLAHYRRPANRIGLLMLAVGISFLSEDLQFSPTAWIHTLGQLTASTSSAFLAHLALAFPTGRLETRPRRALIITGYAGVVTMGFSTALFSDQAAHFRGNAPGLLLIVDLPYFNHAVQTAGRFLAAFIAAAIVIILIRRWWRANAVLRSLLTPVIVVMPATGVITAVGLALRDIVPTHDAFVRAYDVLFAALPLMPLIWMLHYFVGRGTVNRLARRLNEPLRTAEMQDLLARTLRDDSLRIAFWSEAGLVDIHGVPLAMGSGRPPRTITVIGRSGNRQAVLVHDPLLSEDPHVLESVTAATGLALTNQDLSAQVAAQLAEVQASRARIVEAADAERRRIERNLHDGAQQRLVTALLWANAARRRLGQGEPAIQEQLTRIAAQLEAALTDIRELARGLHPAILTEAGLAAAVKEVVGRLPPEVRVRTEIGPLPKLATNIESAAYFVVSEAVTNALKHAHAVHVEVAVACADGVLSVSVRDDGRGGANASGGSGLQGLLDRVATVGGTLTLNSPEQGGTTIKAVLPVDHT
ncbi:sensor histidine kinase [Sinosporangium siamense]|uniref:sensor histidine kinase n=1 Tax=Sinosporangium siamense TaxID=1367973 RepID=UPI0035EA54C4